MAAQKAAGRTAMDEIDAKGNFVRSESSFRNVISQTEDSKFKPESDRYHLYIAYACPWACRVLSVVKLKNLESYIGLSVAFPTFQHTKPGTDEHMGWVFRSPGDNPLPRAGGVGMVEADDALIPDRINDTKSVRELYELTKSDPGKYTVPVLWDKQLNTIVNNESSDLMRMLNTAFNGLPEVNSELDLYPSELRQQIDDVNEWIYHNINNGVYRCGFSRSQEAYDLAIEDLYSALERAEAILSRQRWLVGDGKRFTEADIRLFMTLVRFDEVYTQHFKCTYRYLREYKNLHEFTCDVYQIPKMDSVINMKHIREHYFTSHETINRYGIIPKSPEVDFRAPHDRAQFLSSTPGLPGY